MNIFSSVGISAYFILPALAAYFILISVNCYETSKKMDKKNKKWLKKFNLGVAIYFLILSLYPIKLFLLWKF